MGHFIMQQHLCDVCENQINRVPPNNEVHVYLSILKAWVKETFYITT